jgi:chromate transporter
MNQQINNCKPPAANSELLASSKAVGISQLARTFLFIGITSFGGGLTAYVRRIIVENKKWMTNEEFFPGLALSQSLPGANVVGISLYIANHLCGVRGVVVGLTCLIAPPAIFSFLVGYLYFTFGTLPAMESILKGVAAVDEHCPLSSCTHV